MTYNHTQQPLPQQQQQEQQTTTRIKYPDLPCHWINGRPIQPDEEEEEYTAGPWQDTSEFRDIHEQEDDIPPQLSEEQQARIHTKKQLDAFPILGTNQPISMNDEEEDIPTCGDEYEKLFAAGLEDNNEEEEEIIASINNSIENSEIKNIE
jgi:hypothetical protein